MSRGVDRGGSGVEEVVVVVVVVRRRVGRRHYHRVVDVEVEVLRSGGEGLNGEAEDD
ncbi:hypothetical protein CRG98_028381 [Punica granatum]|uniref:Uncharacterized protein n=1 Tax=Punica granatum TaxID=22663 RepID=A0A2I0J5A5_PUNGR|nr:hypothetical protein CRG98_028381 [Punica granatum]